MACFTIVLGAVLLGLASLAVGLPPTSMSAPGAISQPIFRSMGMGRDTVRDDDRLERRDFIWTYTRDHDQNLCGNSNFVKVDDSGPLLSACKTFTRYNTDGYWLVSGFQRDSSSWMRFASVQSCVIAIRRTDGQTDQVPIGNQDVNDLMDSVIAQFSNGDNLPTVQGNMTCSKEHAGTAAVEWKIYCED
ncbi:hypothetical protein VP1G_06604 [Cytospora mali]|uniref:Ecp2 effector protein-like domain-containing protein n=1 Tax=Cytospora mali TaxID=578113 RepID=A0A194V5X6_CYTMA|nr:hypothetical protein VP1G_06604 [Valsa mali var. pyri (nom. inval.)]